jgi:hypothetical protein
MRHLLFTTFLAGCMVGDPGSPASTTNPAPTTNPTGNGPRVTYVDQDRDGVTDGVDVDSDGRADYNIPPCPSCTPGWGPVCDDPLVDSDGDGIPDGLDLNCDGVVDITWDDGNNGGGTTTPPSGGTSECDVSVDDQEVVCTSDGSGTASCECLVNGQQVSTCTTDESSACNFGVPGHSNCCGF